MKFKPICNYERIDQNEIESGTATAWLSREDDDTCWDKFLQETPLGQFQQSTIWARAKHSEGWKPVRVLVTMNQEIVAGFQVLWKPSWGGRIGYVSKGPVVLPGHHGLAEFVTVLLQKLANKRLRGVVIQPPDWCTQMSEILARSGYLPDISGKVIDATWMVNLKDGFEAVEQRMQVSTRHKVRQAMSRGVRVREGGRHDIEAFFELMLSSCRRQKTIPNPSDVQYFFALWDAAHPEGYIHLFFAEYEGKPLAGLICIAFGKTVTFWKKGWTSTASQRKPNVLTYYEALKWASRSGFESCDYCAFSKQMAIAILSGEPMSSDQKNSRHMFNVSFGGSPRLLPVAMVYFPNPLIRAAYRLFFKKKIWQAEKESKFAERLPAAPA